MKNNKGNQKKIIGLTEKQVLERIKLGKVNHIPRTPSRTFKQILRANLFTSYNFLNAILAIAVLVAGSPKNAIFAGVIIINTIIGIFQEIRAKTILEKLSVVNKKQVNVVRNGKELRIDIEEVVIDDIILLNSGEQILVDCTIIDEAEIEVNEALITGEADAMLKRKGDKLLSGSFVSGGSTYAKVIAVGNDTYASKIAEEARKFKRINSELQISINKIFRLIIAVVFPVGIVLVTTQLFYVKKSWQDAVIGSVSGIVGMVPEGLVLLTSTTFVVAIIRLAKWDTLIQELPATEVLARVDVLCLDKTGTITKGELKVSDTKKFESEYKDDVEEIISSMVNSFKSNNDTGKALIKRYNLKNNLEVEKKIPFSSKRKWSAVEFKDKGVWILGAPEMILKNQYKEISLQVEEGAKYGKRVLLLANFKGDHLDENLNGEITKVALIFMEDIIRDNAIKTISYFNRENVDLKIISGDNPITVSSIAKRVGIKNFDKYIDARELPESESELKKVVEDKSIFGRVSPHQKKNIISCLKKNGHTVSMTGDGVNDVLALKEADCGIAMANGSDATKAVAQLVLMKSDFKALPHVVVEGRRLINNLEKVSELFISKAVYFFILSIIFAVLLRPFPIIPIQLTLVGSISIGIPSFFLALSPNEDVIKGDFLKRVLKFSIPNGVIIGVSTMTIFLFGYNKGLTLEECRTLALIIFGSLSLFVLLKVSRPLNLYRIIIVFSMMILFIMAFIIPFIRKIFVIKFLNLEYLIPIVGVCSIAISGMIYIPYIYSKLKKSKHE